MLSQGVWKWMWTIAIIVVSNLIAAAAAPQSHTPFRIDVIDERGNGIPMVRISAANAWAYSDSQGVVAWRELLDR